MKYLIFFIPSFFIPKNSFYSFKMEYQTFTFEYISERKLTILLFLNFIYLFLNFIFKIESLLFSNNTVDHLKKR